MSSIEAVLLWLGCGRQQAGNRLNSCYKHLKIICRRETPLWWELPFKGSLFRNVFLSICNDSRAILGCQFFSSWCSTQYRHHIFAPLNPLGVTLTPYHFVLPWGAEVLGSLLRSRPLLRLHAGYMIRQHLLKRLVGVPVFQCKFRARPQTLMRLQLPR